MIILSNNVLQDSKFIIQIQIIHWFKFICQEMTYCGFRSEDVGGWLSWRIIVNMPIDHFGLNLFNKHSCGHICGGGSQDPDLTDLIIPLLLLGHHIWPVWLLYYNHYCFSFHKTRWVEWLWLWPLDIRALYLETFIEIKAWGILVFSCVFFRNCWLNELHEMVILVQKIRKNCPYNVLKCK